MGAPSWTGTRLWATAGGLLCLTSLTVGAVSGLPPPAGASSGPTVTVATTSFGPTLVNGSGMALYIFSGDHDATATCTGACAQAWPPLTIPTGTQPTSGPGVTGTVGASAQPDGSLQVTYDGRPLYTFVGDTSPGQVTGDGSAGFSVVKVAPVPAPTTTIDRTPTPTPPVVPTQGPAPGPSVTSPGAAVAAGSSPSPPPQAAGSPAPGRGTSLGAPPALATTGLGGSAILLALVGALLAVIAVGLGWFPAASTRRKR